MHRRGNNSGIALVVAGLAIEATAVIDWKEVPDNVKKAFRQYQQF